MLCRGKRTGMVGLWGFLLGWKEGVVCRGSGVGVFGILV